MEAELTEETDNRTQKKRWQNMQEMDREEREGC